MDYHAIHGHDVSSFDLSSTRKCSLNVRKACLTSRKTAYLP
jgi:hypothetical protein